MPINAGQPGLEGLGAHGSLKHPTLSLETVSRQSLETMGGQLESLLVSEDLSTS